MKWFAASNVAALRRNFAAIQAGSLAMTQRALRPSHLQVSHAAEEFMGGALHEISAARESEVPAACGFVLAQAARHAQKDVIVWIGEDMSQIESGTLYGCGLERLALAPERLVAVRTKRARDVLWAMEEALRCRRVGAVIGEIRNQGFGSNRADLVATRRLSLAAARTNGLALLLRSEPAVQPSAAVTRWIIGAAPSVPASHGMGPPRIQARLIRNRYGPLGSWILEWHSAKQCFDIATANREFMVSTTRDRSHRTTATA